MRAPASSSDVLASDVLAGRIAIVTGGSTGIGFAIAKRFVGLGARVAILGRKADKLADARRAIEQTGGEVIGLQADVRDYPAVEAAVAAVLERFGGLDILVNNAAGNFIAPTHELSPNGWRAVVEIDLNGTFHCCRAAFSALRKSRFGGRIVSIVTDKARTGWPGCAHAAAAKAGVISLTRTLAHEWGPLGIRANTVAPGPIAGTEGVNRLYGQAGSAERELATIPLGRFGDATEIADMCAFLASAAGAFVNGADFVVDGGRAWSGAVTSQ